MFEEITRLGLSMKSIIVESLCLLYTSVWQGWKSV